jgi:hypothetical protein
VLQSDDGEFHFDLYARLLKSGQLGDFDQMNPNVVPTQPDEGEGSRLLTKIRSPFIVDFLAKHDKVLLYKHYVQQHLWHPAAKVMWELALQPCTDGLSSGRPALPPLEHPLPCDLEVAAGGAGVPDPQYTPYKSLNMYAVEAGTCSYQDDGVAKTAVGITLEKRIEYLSHGISCAQAQGGTGGLGGASSPANFWNNQQTNALALPGGGAAPSLMGWGAFQQDMVDRQDVALLQQKVLKDLQELQKAVSMAQAERKHTGQEVDEMQEKWVEQSIQNMQRAIRTLEVSGGLLNISDLYNKPYAVKWWLWDRYSHDTRCSRTDDRCTALMTDALL